MFSVCVCVCVLGSKCLTFFLRDDFESLKCCLDPWLSCMLDCIHIYVFPFLCFKATSIDPWYLSTPGLFVELFSWFLSQSQHLSIARWIDRESSCLLDRCLIVSQSIEVGFFLIYSRHLLIDWDTLVSFFFVLHFFSFVSNASCFSFSCWSMVPCSPRSLYISFLFISGHVFWLFMPFDNRVKKGEKFEKWISFLRRSNRLRGRTSC